MAYRTFSSREFSQNSSRAKKAAQEGPVFITDRGCHTHVLLTVEEYRRLSGSMADTIIDMLAMPGVEETEFEPARAEGFSKPADLS
ncbi:MAG: type II toxin-antitoxin system Phd/YefM family antitoxin [Betaproteobacteria bacterium]|nr:type II toxin-antitoxin system Phd/YefM family antitoxin [Betaproteobacteria bacterium]MDE2622931.1 type II toxin-antitoxin system Phd/YefM family antitoxin [Betaproteobacteria bacterium]